MRLASSLDPMVIALQRIEELEQQVEALRRMNDTLTRDIYLLTNTIRGTGPYYTPTRDKFDGESA